VAQIRALVKDYRRVMAGEVNGSPRLRLAKINDPEVPKSVGCNWKSVWEYFLLGKVAAFACKIDKVHGTSGEPAATRQQFTNLSRQLARELCLESRNFIRGEWWSQYQGVGISILCGQRFLLRLENYFKRCHESFPLN
jgi:hypothetical protein